jgi:prolyl 4-hydroxylase
MSDVEGGGHTIFPRAGGLPQPMSMAVVDQGLLVKPERGKVRVVCRADELSCELASYLPSVLCFQLPPPQVIIFYSLLPNGNIDEFSLHGGTPVLSGTKWAANKWVWNKPRQ